MNNILLKVLIVLAVVVGGYMYFAGDRGVEEVTSSINENTTNESVGKKMAFAEFMKQGGSYKCTVRQSVNDVDSNGTIFVSNGMVRGSFTTTVSGKETMSNILVRDGFTYVWSADMPVAMKIAIPKTEVEANVNTGMSGSYAWNAEQIGDYDCDTWNADQATFAVPTGVQFMDPAQMGAMYQR